MSASGTIDELVNQALTEWVQTFPRDQRLTSYLATLPDVSRPSVESKARQILVATEVFLHEATARGEIDANEFSEALAQHLYRTFPTISESATRAMQSFAGWYGWREGYFV